METHSILVLDMLNKRKSSSLYVGQKAKRRRNRRVMLLRSGHIGIDRRQEEGGMQVEQGGHMVIGFSPLTRPIRHGSATPYQIYHPVLNAKFCFVFLKSIFFVNSVLDVRSRKGVAEQTIFEREAT
jgi:hypothetical protein